MHRQKKFRSDNAARMANDQSQIDTTVIVLAPDGQQAVREAIGCLDKVLFEVETLIDLAIPDPHLKIAAHVMMGHLDGRLVTPSSAIAAAGVPYATAVRRLKALTDAGLVEQRPKPPTGKTYSLHPSAQLVERWLQLASRLPRIAEELAGSVETREDYYFGGSYQKSQVIPPIRPLTQPLALPGGLRILVHGDPTFMVMDNLKRQFEQVVGCPISQRAFSIDRLHGEALRNAERKESRYDIIAVDLPWIGEFAEKGVLEPLDAVMDVERLDHPDFHTAGWQAAHWGGRPYGVPSQTTPELLFYRRDLFAEADLDPPRTTDALLAAAKHFHTPARAFWGIAFNGARGTPLGHQFLFLMAAFGGPVVEMPRIAGGYDAAGLANGPVVPTIDTEPGHAAADFLHQLLAYAPPDILSMSWYERVRPYAEGRVAMAYGYTLLVPYFERDANSPAARTTDYLPHPAGGDGASVAPVGGYVLGIPKNLAPDRRRAAVDALVVFTSPEAQKLYAQNGSRTCPRYSVGSDPEVRQLSTAFEAVDQMSWRDELQFWPRPPIPQINEIVQICGEEMHDMLRGSIRPAEALKRAQGRADAAVKRP